ncbi:MAG: multicopper oxidase domain-containing protein [Chloroflexi bacterium]|jgi:nitrite reductase (NO-forming)|nr:multicopper oxidase domain-containing protein [Chloroflexota bacterium]
MTTIVNKLKYFTFVLLVGSLLIAACSPASPVENSSGSDNSVDVHYTLKTGSGDGKLIYIGVGGDIDGVVNPDLVAKLGDTVAITLVNDDGRFHDFVIDEFNAATSVFGEAGEEETIQFTVDQADTFFYYCSVTGHRKAGMEGQMIVSNQ